MEIAVSVRLEQVFSEPSPSRLRDERPFCCGLLAIDPADTAAREALLPDRCVAAHPEHQLEQREEESREAQIRRCRMRAARRATAAL
jgi:hypothetical protein